jgi:DNA-binding transcriptional MerR regulator
LTEFRNRRSHLAQPVRIGEAAQLTNLSVRTLRHWDEVGLVIPRGRTDGGYRLYTEADVQRLLIVRYMKPLGLSVDEMHQLLTMRDRFLGADPERLQPDEQEARSALAKIAEDADHRALRLMAHLSEVLDFAARLRLELESASPSLGGTMPQQPVSTERAAEEEQTAS